MVRHAKDDGHDEVSERWNTRQPRQKISFDPNFNGPLQKRSCTDVICCMLLFVFVGCWIGVGIFVFVKGDPNKLLIPRDSDGGRCGYDAHLLDKKYLVFFDLTQCLSPTVPFTGCQTPQVCVEKCPEKNFIHKFSYSINAEDVTNDPKFTVCKYGIKPDASTIDGFVKSGDCAGWVLRSNDVLKRCLYRTEDRKSFRIPGVSALEGDEITLAVRYLSMAKSWISLFIQYTIARFTDDYNTQQAGYRIVEDLTNTWREILLGVALAVIVSIIYIVLLRWLAAVMVWLSILGALGGLAFCVYWSVTNYQYYREHPYAHEDAKNVFEREFQKKETWLIISIIFSVILGILLLLVVFLRKRISLAIALIKEGSKAVGSITSTLFFPIAPWILQLGVICYAVAVAIYAATLGDPLYEIRRFDPEKCICNENAGFKNGAVCDVTTFDESLKTNCTNVGVGLCEATCRFIQISNVGLVPYIHAYNVIGFFWGVFFMTALCEMILAATFATWYWTFDKSKVPFFTLTNATWRTVRYHLGTLAFGSLIITICRMIRVILEYIDHKLKKYENPITRAILCCMKCFFWCLEKFLKFINRNAYIMCAIHGKNFCASAKDAFNLLMRNIIRVAVLDKVTDFLFFLSKILIIIGNASIIWAIIEYVRVDKPNYIYVPVVFTAILTYFVTCVFFKVYVMAVDTLFLCCMEDLERNDGSADRPYFMSRGLRNVLNKKNKKLN